MIYVNFNSKVKQKIEEFLEEHSDLTKSWIAEQMGMSKQSLSSWETSTNPTITKLLLLTYILKCSISDLYDCEFHVVLSKEEEYILSLLEQGKKYKYDK